MNRLKELREQKKITQTKLVQELNMPLITYTKYENGIREPRLEILIKLADYYNVSLDYLIGRQFTNEIGYLDKQQTMAIQGYLKLNPQNQRNVEIFILNTLAKQI